MLHTFFTKWLGPILALTMILSGCAPATPAPTATLAPVTPGAARTLEAAATQAAITPKVIMTSLPTTTPTKIDVYSIKSYNGVTYTITANSTDKLATTPIDGNDPSGHNMYAFYDPENKHWMFITTFANTSGWLTVGYGYDSKKPSQTPKLIASYDSCTIDGRGIKNVVVLHCNIYTVEDATNFKVVGELKNAWQFIKSPWDGKKDAGAALIPATKTPTPTVACPSGYEKFDPAKLAGRKFSGQDAGTYIQDTIWTPGYKVVPLKNSAKQVFSVALFICGARDDIYMDISSMPTPIPSTATRTPTPTRTSTPTPTVTATKTP